MVTKRMSSKEARDNFSDLLASVHYGGEPVIVERKGRPFAVVISPAEYERYRELAKARFFQITDEIKQANADADPAQVEADVAAALEAVRQEENAPTAITTDRR